MLHCQKALQIRAVPINPLFMDNFFLNKGSEGNYVIQFVNSFQKPACLDQQQPFPSAHTLNSDSMIKPYSLAQVMGSSLLKIVPMECFVQLLGKPSHSSVQCVLAMIAKCPGH